MNKYMKSLLAIVSYFWWRILFWLDPKVLVQYGACLVFPKLRIKGVGNRISLLKNARLIKGIINVSGQNNIITNDGMLFKSAILIDGVNNTLTIKNGVNINMAHIIIKGNECSIEINELSSFGNSCWMVLMGNNKKIVIGKNCMIADQVDLWASDSHPIFDENIWNAQGDYPIINPSGSIFIHDHVWLGKKTCVLKNVTIEKNSVVGMNSTVTRDVPRGSVVAGNPAKLVRRNINWSSQHITT